ncbi:MAG: lipoyl synthase [Candidatus Marinimicrobia bacterium]|nr:lipoyl synthase [Candidatus Neomarinimicrobiota bacterium]
MSDMVALQPHSGPANEQPAAPVRRPPWIKIKLRTGDNYKFLKELVHGRRLHTVCEEARCPNIYECWENRTATLMILGEVCTRSCGFCAVTTGRPAALDPDEPRRVGEAVQLMGLGHCVITSVNRDELPDGGAAIWAETIRQVRRQAPDCTLEVLVPDFGGDEIAQQQVIDAGPHIFGHNLETVPRLYRQVRPQAEYRRSLDLLAFAAGQGLAVKSGIMIGFGETEAEVEALMADAAATGCRLFTVGQYLQPTREHLAVVRYVPPVEFERYREFGLQLGFAAVEAGPLVRSSYHAERMAQAVGISSSVQEENYAAPL